MERDLGAGLRGLGESQALVINGGFFCPDQEPVGLVVVKGVVLSRFLAKADGGVMTINGGRGTLHQTKHFQPSSQFDFAVQCFPRLVANGHQVQGLDSQRRADRTALCLRGSLVLSAYLARTDHSKGMGGPSLAAFAGELARDGCSDALNLDGGPSAGAAWYEDGALHELPPRGPVRHGIRLRPGSAGSY